MEDITWINNDDYGAPEIRRNYRKYVRNGLITAVVLHFALILSFLAFSQAGDVSVNKRNLRFVDIKDIEMPPPLTDRETPETDIEEIVKALKDLSALEPQPVPQNLAEILTIKTMDELNNINTNISRDGDSIVISSNNINDLNINTVNDNIIKDVVIPEKDTYKDFEVEVIPNCINLSAVKSSIVYPKIAQESGIEGRVAVKVLVGTEGNVIKVGTITGNEVFHDEVKEKSMNLLFTPGLQNNKPVKVWVTVPFNFKLN